jgi:uncharacterized membrane protein YphA (DoxX/SURF4 family)
MHLNVWQQDYNSILFSSSDPSGIGCGVYFLTAFLIGFIFGPGNFSIDGQLAKNKKISSMISLILRLGWGGSLLFLSGTGITKYNAGYNSNYGKMVAQSIAFAPAPLSNQPEFFFHALCFAEIVVPVFLILGLYTRLAATIGSISFAVACHMHLNVWEQDYTSILVSSSDPSRIGCGVYFLTAFLIGFIFGPGYYSIDGQLEQCSRNSRKEKMM